ncbi:hypothetical protein IU500_03170 [Nocardia terpenica]|uniref:hypothetical protein n=1 Tax=Nocardia terpenica TaxID=455432 RepID=UPI001895C954|nr:hypothetical protein [Nocardia terpenica]MBF6059419.1 hypothetical protein [Nocardia terpenica]MBF6103042.1 hypothetical protein [Nocardia terpenica]MBF6110769.1 hypothetical protein [Nocardia terpenica]MBF6116900.1 hypothetical protein [Nocardia terpenica]MBF6151262.1 hypothetical protein [Nocardia terpenica]
MDLPRLWVGIDVIGTLIHGEIVVHSAGGRRVARRLRRVAPKLGYDYQGENLFRGVVTDAMSGPRIDCARTAGGIECRLHWVIAFDGTAVGLVVWLAPGPVPPRPVYNSWTIDLARLITAGGGDNLTLYGVKRQVGEYKPFPVLLKNMIPDDAPGFTAMIHNLRHEREGVLCDTLWSVRPGTTWNHLWSSATTLGAPGPGRTVYGLTTQLPHRDLDARLGTLVRYTGATLVMVDVVDRVVINASGDVAEALLADEQRLRGVLAQIDLDAVIGEADTEPVVEQMISIEGSLFRAALFALPARPVQPGSVIAILLVAAPQRSWD